jgi:CRP-like cAMP-binding protein
MEPEEEKKPRRLRDLVSRARMKGAASSVKGLEQRSTYAVGMRDKGAGRRTRTVSVDAGDAAWPSNDDIGYFKTETRSTEADLAQVIEDIRKLNIDLDAKAMQEQLPGMHGKVQPTTLVDVVNEASMGGGRRRSLPGHGAKLSTVPLSEQLVEYPALLKDQVTRCANALVATFLMPIMARKHHFLMKRRFNTQRANELSPVRLEFLASMTLLQDWPKDALRRLQSAMYVWAYEPGHAIIHEREPSKSIVFLATGTVELQRRGERRLSPRRKRLGASTVMTQSRRARPNMFAEEAPKVFQTLVAPSVLGEFNPMSEDPWSFTAKAVSAVDCWVLDVDSFRQIMMSIPAPAIARTKHVALQQRNNSMRETHVMTAVTVRECLLFNDVSADFATEISRRVEPHAVGHATELTTENERADAMYFLRRGTVKLFRIVNNERTLISTQTAPYLIGDTAVIHASSYENTAVTTTDADCYMLSKAAYDSAVKQFPSDVGVIMEAVRRKRHDDLQRNLLRYRHLIPNIPLLGALNLSAFDIRDFLKLMQPKTYAPLTAVCSKSTYCDRIILLTKGNVRIGDSSVIGPGDCIGWTCCLPHRWGDIGMTLQTSVEVFEVTYADYMRVLHQKGALQQVLQQTKMIMFPKAFPQPDVRALQVALPPHDPGLIPKSDSRVVNLNEMRFCTAHMGLLEEARKEEDKHLAVLKAQTPPAYRVLAGGLWIPKTQKARGFTTSSK